MNDATTNGATRTNQNHMTWDKDNLKWRRQLTVAEREAIKRRYDFHDVNPAVHAEDSCEICKKYKETSI